MEKESTEHVVAVEPEAKCPNTLKHYKLLRDECRCGTLEKCFIKKSETLNMLIGQEEWRLIV